ncbi:MAG: hypothetical protein KAQ96_01975, partial [Thermoplasmata archaeon]|nr:hypothetical protein [Thermoplasmata archaeon]
MRTKLGRFTALALTILLIAPLPLLAAGEDADAPEGPGPMLDILDPRLLNSTYTTRMFIIDGVMDSKEWAIAEGTEAL